MIHWLFIVSVALFVSGIGFIVAGARSARLAPAATTVAAVPVVPVATVKQIMNGIAVPAATVVFDAVSTTYTAAGIEERAPRNDAEWQAVGDSAAALIESGNLLLLEGRAVDKEDWVRMSQALIDSAKVSLRAAEAKSTEDLLASGEALNESCDTCHTKYQRGS